MCFWLIIPKHESEAYWEEIEEGALKACEARRDFNIEVKIKYYKRFHVETFNKTVNDCLEANP
jgi:LacI family transcriptional regulator